MCLNAQRFTSVRDAEREARYRGQAPCHVSQPNRQRCTSLSHFAALLIESFSASSSSTATRTPFSCPALDSSSPSEQQHCCFRNREATRNKADYSFSCCQVRPLSSPSSCCPPGTERGYSRPPASISYSKPNPLLPAAVHPIPCAASPASFRFAWAY